MESDGGVCGAKLTGRTKQEVRQLAHMLVEQPGYIALLVGEEQDKVGLAFARSDDRDEDMNLVMQDVCAVTGCRGGGNAAFATGGGTTANAADVLEAARRALRKRRVD
jgi:alanyl-tRNA synthetase